MTTKRHPYDQWSPDARALDLVGDKWTLLIVRDLLPGPTRFVELQRRLPGISTEQLRTRLNRMVADGLLTKARYRELPPRVDYELTAKGRDLVSALAALAEWGFTHAWSEPKPLEAVDLTALFRLLPATLEELTAGERVVLIVADEDVPAHVVRRDGWQVAVDHVVPFPPSDDDTTVMSATRAEWIDAIVSGDRERLAIHGSPIAAQQVMRALSGKAGVQAIGKAAA